MRYHADRLGRTRARILAGARRLFAERGYAATTIEGVMAAAGLTRGGFYRHFGSKAELYAQATREAGSPQAPIAGRRGATASPVAARWAGWLRERPLALLAADAASEIPAVRRAAQRRLDALVQEVRDVLEVGDDAAALGASADLAATALVIGALALAQAQPDSAVRQRLLASSLRGLSELASSAAPSECEYLWAVPGPADGLRHGRSVAPRGRA